MSKQTQYIVVRNGFWAGVIGDVIMYSILLGMYVVNYKYLGNNGVLNVLFTLLVVTFITNMFGSKYKRTFYSADDAIKYLAEGNDLVTQGPGAIRGAANPPKSPPSGTTHE